MLVENDLNTRLIQTAERDKQNIGALVFPITPSYRKTIG